MTVYELTCDQLDELRHNLFYNFRYNEDERREIKKHLSKEDEKYLRQVNLCYWDIPDDIIHECYSGFIFVNDDFFCTAGIYEND